MNVAFYEKPFLKNMIIENSKIIGGVKILTPRIYKDHRGENIETYNQKEYNCLTDEKGAPLKFVIDTISISRKDVLRGMHGDMVTWKLIQCLYGTIYFVIADVRRERPSYRKWEKLILNDKKRQQVLVPPGCLNGHLCLSESCIFSYKKTEYYKGVESEIAMKWNSLELNISWPIKNPILSRRDDE